MTILLGLIKTLLFKLLTEKAMSQLFILLLEAIAKRTSNNIDDRLVIIVKEAFENKQGGN